MHAFWTVHDAALARVQQAMFAKNISMLGAALLLTKMGGQSGDWRFQGRHR